MSEHRSYGRRRSDDALRHSEDRYRRLVELSPDAVLIVQDRKVMFANPAAVQLLAGGDESKVIGRDALEFLHADDRALVEDRMNEVLAGARQHVFQERRYR